MRYNWFLFVGLLILTWSGSGCSENPSNNESKNGPERRLYIVTTTGMLGDGVKHIAGNTASVESLMGPGVDPHGYTVSQGDISKLRQADLIVYNGLHLEGKMQEVLQNLAMSKPVLALGDGLDAQQLRKVGQGETVYDPHIWFDVPLWSKGLLDLARRMGQTFPDEAPLFAQNAESYTDSLQILHEQLQQWYSSVPPANRVLVTSHDAFYYFGAAYGFEVLGLQGVSTVAEFGLRDMTAMVNLLSERKIPAVFVESSVPPRSIQSVVEGCRQKGHPLRIGGELYSDAMGAPGTKDGNYTGMLLHNARVITAALGGKADEPLAGASAARDPSNHSIP